MIKMEVVLSRKVGHKASLIRLMNADNEVCRIFDEFDNPYEIYDVLFKFISKLQEEKLL